MISILTLQIMVRVYRRSLKGYQNLRCFQVLAFLSHFGFKSFVQTFEDIVKGPIGDIDSLHHPLSLSDIHS